MNDLEVEEALGIGGGRYGRDGGGVGAVAEMGWQKGCALLHAPLCLDELISRLDYGINAYLTKLN